MKALGKKPPHPSIAGRTLMPSLNREHYRTALIEAADELDKSMDWDIADLRKMSKRLRISAGVKK